MCPASLQGWESGSHTAAEITLLVLKPISGSPCIANSCLSPAVLFLSLSPAQGLAEGVENHFGVCGGVNFLSSVGKKICRLKKGDCKFPFCLLLNPFVSEKGFAERTWIAACNGGVPSAP